MTMPAAAEPIRSFRFSTLEVPPCERGPAVRALRERGILPIEPLPRRDVHVRIVKCVLPGVAIFSGTLSGLRQDGLGGDSDDLFFGVNVAGCSTFVQRGRDVVLREGSAILVNPTEGPFAMLRPTPARFMGLRMPRRAIAPLVAHLDDRASRPIVGAPALNILTSYAAAIANDKALPAPDVSRLVAGHLHDLIALTLGPTRDAAVAANARGVRGARLAAIKSDIAAHLGDCALSISAVAARQGVTARYVHKLFEGEGVTYSQFVLRQRLESAYRMLRARFATQSISAIAYDVGFGDLSYFNRTFRRQYGTTPSDIRGR